MENSNITNPFPRGNIKLRRRKPLNDPQFSKFCKYCWPNNYPGDYDDSNSALQFLHLFDSKEGFFRHFKITETLIKYTETWTFEQFVGSFLYSYITSRLLNNNNVLTEYDWQKIITLSLKPSSNLIVIDILKRNNLDEFSKKKSIIDGAVQSFSRFSYDFDFNSEVTVTQILNRVLRFLQIPEKSIKLLVDSSLCDKNTEKIVQFLKNFTGVDS